MLMVKCFQLSGSHPAFPSYEPFGEQKVGYASSGRRQLLTQGLRVLYVEMCEKKPPFVVLFPVPPSKPVLLDKSGRSLSGVVGPFKEGQTLFLACEAEPGK